MTQPTTHCQSLKYEYDQDTGVCTFEDGTVYTVEEMIFIARQRISVEDMDMIHLVKRIFDGELVMETNRFPRRHARSHLERYWDHERMCLRRVTAPEDELTEMGRRLRRSNPVPHKPKYEQVEMVITDTDE